jgi:hypothetical protein
LPDFIDRQAAPAGWAAQMYTAVLRQRTMDGVMRQNDGQCTVSLTVRKCVVIRRMTGPLPAVGVDLSQPYQAMDR